jgi:hypothetical protein
MRFGDAEVDAVYNQLLKPVIEQVAIPRVVNRIVHNDRIDSRIRREIEAAEIAVADLTHARPSVYYEAGFAERRVPVIYTCRKDHLSRSAADDARVHFDLAMANCVAWRSPTDQQFRRRFRAQFRHVIAPILERHEQAARNRAEEAAFAAHSETWRLKTALNASVEEARRAGWKASPYDPTKASIHDNYLSLFFLSAGAEFADRRYGYRLTTFVRPAIPVGMLRSLTLWLLPLEYVKRDHPMLDHIVLISLNRVQTRLIEGYFANFSRDLGCAERSWTGWPPKPAGLPAWALRITVIDNVKAEDSLRERLRPILPRAVLRPLLMGASGAVNNVESDGSLR